MCVTLLEQGIPQQPDTKQIARLIVFFLGYFFFFKCQSESNYKNKNVKVKVKYRFVLHTGFAGSPFLL